MGLGLTVRLGEALRYSTPQRVAIVGGGGKTTCLFRLAREQTGPVWVSTTTHLGLEQIGLADRHVVIHTARDILNLPVGEERGVTLVTGAPAQNKRIGGVQGELLLALAERAERYQIPLLIEADGSKGLPVKAPDVHEPAIPGFVELVIYTVGIDGIGQPLDDAHIHRAELFSGLSGLELNSAVSVDGLARMLTHPEGGLKAIPAGARRILLLNRADTEALRDTAGLLGSQVSPVFDGVVAASLGMDEPRIYWARENIAAVVLAAGGSSRLGRPKQLIEWKGEPLVRRCVKTALAAGLRPIVVSGANAAEVEAAVHGLDVRITFNPEWQNGQSTSLQAGLRALPPRTGAAIFLLSDQPMLTPALLQKLVEAHSHSLAPVIAPFVGPGHARRANPVLFDKVTFPDLAAVAGDVGGRAIFSKYPVSPVAWDDENLLLDIDSQADLDRLFQIPRGGMDG